VIEGACSDGDRQVLGVGRIAGDQPDRVRDTGRLEIFRSGSGALDVDPGFAVVPLVDHRQAHPCCPQLFDHHVPESAVAAHDPVPLRRRSDRDDGLARQAGDEIAQAVALRGGDRRRKRLGELLERVDHQITAEDPDVGLGLDIADARQHRNSRGEQPHIDRDRLVGGIVVGERDHTLAVRVHQPGLLEQQGVFCVGHHGGRVDPELVHPQLLQAGVIELDGDEAQAQMVEAVTDHASGLADAADDIEGRADLVDAPGEPGDLDGVLEALVLKQRQDIDQRIRPGGDRGVDGQGHPHPLQGVVGVRHLAESDGRGRETDDVERVEDREWRAGAPGQRIGTGNQCQAGGAEGVDADDEQ